jgi:hypothetical protein
MEGNLILHVEKISYLGRAFQYDRTGPNLLIEIKKVDK